MFGADCNVGHLGDVVAERIAEPARCLDRGGLLSKSNDERVGVLSFRLRSNVVCLVIVVGAKRGSFLRCFVRVVKNIVVVVMVINLLVVAVAGEHVRIALGVLVRASDVVLDALVVPVGFFSAAA